MPTIIDELIVKFTLDTLGIRQGQATIAGSVRQIQELFQNFSTNVGRSTSAAGVGLSTIRFGLGAVGVAAGAAAAAYTALLKAAESFATKIAAQNVTLTANAAAVRETTEEYSTLGRAMEAAIPGGSQGFARTVQNITNALAETRYTGKPTGIAQAAITFGLSLTDETVDKQTGMVKRHYKDAQRLAFDFIDKLKAQGKDYADAVWWAERYGIDKTLVYMRYKLTEEQQRQILAQQRMNALTEEQAQASQRVWTAYQGLEGTISHLGNVALTTFEKQITKILGYSTDLASTFADKIIPAIGRFYERLDKEIPENSALRKWDFGLLDYLKKIDGILDKWFGEGTSKKTPLKDLGKKADDLLGTGPGGWLDRILGGQISEWLYGGPSGGNAPPPPSVGTPERPGYSPLFPHQGYTPSAPGAGGTLPPDSGGVDRSRFAGVVNDPALVYRMADMVAGEVGKSAPVESQKVMLETMFNRAQRRDISVQQALLSVAQDQRRGYYASDTYRNQVTAADLEKFKRDVLAPVLAGSDYARGFTGNASDDPRVPGGRGMVALHQRQKGTPAFPIQAAGGQTEWIFDEDRRRPAVPHLPSIGSADQATRPSLTAVPGTNWNGAPLSAVERWGFGGSGTTNNTNDNSRSAEVNIGVFNQNVGSSTMVGSAQDFTGAIKENMVGIQGNFGPI